MTIGTQHTVRTAGLLMIALLIIGTTGCGSGGARNDVETDASADTESAADMHSAVGQPVVDADTPSTKEIVVGDVIGLYIDKQSASLAALESAKTERVDETIRMTWDSNVLFGFDSAMLKTDGQTQIERMANIFQKYPDTHIVVAGHTDSQGDEDYNFTLSERRALSVRNCLIDAGVPHSRIETVGFGEFRPVATNDTEEGQRLNRRVEIEIHPNETLKSRAAENDSTR